MHTHTHADTHMDTHMHTHGHHMHKHMHTHVVHARGRVHTRKELKRFDRIEGLADVVL